MGHNWRRVLLALLALVAVAQCAPLLGDCALLELLPTDLTDSISFVQPDGQAHFQGEFFVDFQRENHHNITFDLKFDTTFRFYVAPHEIDIDLWLYPIGGRNSIAHSALDVAGAPEVIFGHLPPGGYRLTMFFFGDPSQLSACPAVVVEMEMIPDTILASRMASFHCPFQPVYPQIDFTDLNEGYPFSFATTDLPSEQADVLNVQSTASKLRSTVTWATAYNFTVPRVSGRPVLWQVEASLGYQFLSGGSLGLLLVPNSNSSAPPDPRCYLDGKGCWLGSNLRMNEHVISELVRPGDYQLWLFDQVGEKDPNITLPCTPFSLTLSIRPTTEEEDLLNCAAPRVPTTLNGPDGLDALGYYTLTADMLLEIDPSTLPTEHRISLRPAADSLVRVEASESLFDVDVALYLADSDEPLAMSNRFAGYTDAVALDVAANTNYTIVLRFWGRYAPRFCETFPLAIAVAPVPSFDFCTAAVPSLPDLSALDAALAASEKLKREDYGPFVFDYAANYEARAVYRHNFTVVDVTNVKFVLGFNFLLGGLDIALRNRATDERLFGEQRGNVALLQGELHPGDYEVSVLLSPTQTLYRTNLTGVFPPCLRYTLGVAAVPSASAADDLCWQVLKTPTDLRELAYLGSAPYVHITDAFLVPDVGGKKSEDDDIAIKVAQASLLHVYTPARADLDIRLTLEDDAGKRVATSDNQYGEEEILVPLDAGERYTLTIRYYRPRQALPLCATYDLHLLVEPLPPGKPTPPAPGACSAAPLPADLFAGSGAPGWAVTRSASLLVAKDASAVVDVPLTLNQPTYLVAQLAFPFALTQISVSVLTDADATPIASSRPSVTGSALDVVLLPAGTFTLRLATLSAPAQGVAVCVPFTIVVASAPAASESLLSQPCTATSMPASLNAVPFFHPLGGYSLHFTRELLISDIIDETAFELTAESLVRVFTSGHPSVDVDVYLYSLTPHDPDSKVLAVSNGYGEELVVARLPRGSYTLVLRYAGGTDALILPDECIYFTLEMAAAPIADLLDNPDITQPCPAHAPAVTTLEANTSYSGLQWLVPLPSNVSLRFQQTFELRDVGYLAADLRYDFLIGGLSLTLARAGSPVHDAEINMNHAYLRTALPAGQYTLAVTSNTATLNTYGDLSFVRCSQFELDFLLNTTADPSFCDAVDVLPTDLFSANGGSQPYGGPQSPLDGSVQIYGDRFLAQRGVSEADVLFMAPRNVFARFFATAGAGSDLDFVLYSDAGKGQILAYSIGFEDFESSLFLLPAQPQPYLLAIKFWRLPRLTCPYYRFEAVIRDNATVADDLRCPAYLPPDDRQVPPSAVTLTAGSSLESSSSDYVLTKARLTQEARGSRWEHRISLNLPGNTTLVASVLFDFLTADFRLALSGPDTRLDGSPDYADDRASELNFENRLEADLPKAGVYTLLLRFQLVTSATQLADYCFNFAFSLSLASSAAPRPTVLAVDPPSGDNLQAAAGLTVRVAFSEQFAQVAATTDFTTVAALRTQGSGQLVRPSSAAPFNNRNGLRFVWSAAALADGAVYTLVLTPSLLSSTSAGVPFADYPFAHVYSFLSCDCNGHGTCTKDATGLLRCACTFPYAGEACQACADGYHGVGGRCEQDAQCTPALCGEHGRCDDSSGVPRCFCNDRYATLGDRYCSVCAPGYVNYPNCTARDEALEESTLCTAPLLPSTLDGLMAERDEVHLSGDFFLDADTKVHDVDFELRRDSVLRVYAEPHWIDVDLWLFPLHPDGSVGDDIAYSLRVYAEEELYIVLNGSAAAPPRYRLSFRYFIWNRKATPTDCETLNVELALKPLDTVQREVAAAARLCPAGADLLPMPLERRLPLLEVPTSGYSVHDSTVYALHAHDGVAPDAPDFFWNVTFSVAEVPNTEVLLTVQLDHQFLPGALALLLETGDARRHCGQFGASSARATCQPGRSAFNRNMLFTMLPPGTYTLWIYQPAPLLPAVAACAPFNFAFNISYVPTEDEDIFNCAAPRLPLSLNAPGMLSPRGFLHLAQEFLIEPDNAPVAFQLAAPSRIRVAASSALPIYFFLRSHDRANSSFVAFGLALHGSAQLAAALAPGAYSLHFWSWDSAINPADAAFCVPTLVQLALSPDGHQPATLCPPGVVASRLPDLTRTRVPTTLPPTRYYALRPARDTEASYNLRFESDTHVDVALTSDFVSAGVGVRLEYTASGRAMVVDGEYAFNQARLSGVFGRGNYTLRLLFPRSDTADVVCTPFDFSIELAPARAFVEPACDGEPLPLNLNELRYLGAAPVLDYFGVFRVPLVSDHSISFTNVTATGPGPSALHVFLDQPAAVMFQGALHRLDAAGARTPVAPLVSGLLRAQLEPNTTYQIELALARQLGDAGDATCVSVPIMWSVAPLALWPLPAECPQAARDHLPTIVPPPVGLFKQFQRWNYSSVALGEALYLQQAFDAPRSFSYTFDTDSLGRLYAAVGYDLRAGLLQVALTSASTGRMEGTLVRDQSVLVLENLAPGTYTLEVSEPRPERNVNRLTCLAFSLELIIERDASMLLEEVTANELPASLDTVAFLAYSPTVHFAVQALFTRPLLGVADPTIAFRLATRSAVRVLVQRSRDFAVRVLFDNAANPDEGAGAFLLGPGPHTLTLQRSLRWQVRDSADMWERDVQLGVEISIVPLAEADALYATGWVADVDSCAGRSVARVPSDVDPDAEGFYSFASTRLALSPAQQQRAATAPVHTVQFVLSEPSIVYAEVTYDPLYGDVAVRLVDSERILPPYFATVGQGRSVVHTVAPAEVYNLELYQPSPALGQPHCVPLSFRLVIHDAVDARGGLVCSDFNRLPFSLSTLDGGSLAYGGPMSQGAVSIYGDEFLYPPNSDSDSLRLDVAVTTLVSVYVAVERGAPLNTALYAPNATDPVAALFADAASSTHRQLYIIEPGRGRAKPFTLTIEFPWARPLIACPYYTFALVARPLSVVQSNLVCLRSVQPQAIPARVPLSYGFAEVQLTSSFAHRTDEVLPDLFVNFTLANASLLVTSLAFDSLVLSAELILQRADNPAQIWSRSVVRASAYRSQPFDMEVRLNVPLLEPAAYTLRIRRQVFPAVPFTAASLCLPFSWFFFVAPHQGAPYLLADPPGGVALRPETNLVLMLSFSAAPCNASGAPFNFATSHAFATLFSLVPQGGADVATLLPLWVQPSSESMTWRLVFNGLEANTTYVLRLADGALFDSLRREFRQPVSARYAVGQSGCSGHGALVVGECTCDEGYEGAYCEECADGFHEQGSDDQTVCVPDGEKCAVDSCGCQPPVAPCQPLGACDDSSGTVQCTCFSNRAGRRCDSCLPGYGPFPACPLIATSAPPCPCAHGSCAADGSCQCPPNWRGDLCNACAAGFEGDDCHASPATTATSSPATTSATTTVTTSATTSATTTATSASSQPTTAPMSLTRITEIAAAVFVVIIAAGVAALCWVRRKQQAARRYADLPSESDTDVMLEERTVTVGNEKVAVKVNDDEDTFNPRSKNQDKMFEL